MRIKVKYFAAIREACGKSEEILDTKSKNTHELYDELSKMYGITIGKDNLKVAINEEYSSFDTELNELDVVALIPPVAGG